MSTKLKIVNDGTPTINLTEIEKELRPLDSGKLRNILAESITDAARFIARAAICVKLMEERGDSLVGISQVNVLRKVASGQVLPELAWAFSESPARNIVIQAPLPDQIKLVKQPMQPVVEQAPTGGVTTRMIDMTKATKDVVKQVVGPEGIRSPEEQIAYLAAQRLESKARTGQTLKASLVPSDPLTRQVKVSLTEAEWHALNVHASNAMLTPGDFVRKTLNDARLLNKPRR